MSPEAILARIKAQHGAGFTLTGSYAGGESGHGAFRVEDETGKPWVLKLGGDSHSERASRATVILRKRGYPAPLYRLYGSVDGFHFSVQEQMPGSSIEIRAEHVTQLIRLNATQQDVAPDRFGEWRDHMGERDSATTASWSRSGGIPRKPPLSWSSCNQS
jgi:hypothetical protein